MAWAPQCNHRLDKPRAIPLVKIRSLLPEYAAYCHSKRLGFSKMRAQSTCSFYIRAPESNKSTVLFVFCSAFSVAPKVTYRQYAPLGAPWRRTKIRRNLCVFIYFRDPKARTGYEQKKVSSIVYKLKKQGKVKAVQKGVYVKSWIK